MSEMLVSGPATDEPKRMLQIVFPIAQAVSPNGTRSRGLAVGAGPPPRSPARESPARPCRRGGQPPRWGSGLGALTGALPRRVRPRPKLLADAREPYVARRSTQAGAAGAARDR